MDILGDFGLYLVRAFGFLAQWLGELTSPLPWPLVMAFAAIPLLFVANIVIWFLRGIIWPVRCKYPETTVRTDGDKACRVMVAGEWGYCRHHKKKKVNSNGKMIDPKLPRWQVIVGGQRVDRTDIKIMNKRVSLLFYRGFARKPLQVLGAIPDILSELKTNAGIMIARLQRRPIEEGSVVGSISAMPTIHEQEKYNAFSKKAERADEALRFLRWMLPIAFISIAASSFIQGPWTLFLEYAALFMLWIVIEIIRKGLLQNGSNKDWLIEVVKGTLQGFGIVVTVAIIAVLADDYILPFLEKVLTK